MQFAKMKLALLLAPVKKALSVMELIVQISMSVQAKLMTVIQTLNATTHLVTLTAHVTQAILMMAPNVQTLMNAFKI